MTPNTRKQFEADSNRGRANRRGRGQGRKHSVPSTISTPRSDGHISDAEFERKLMHQAGVLIATFHHTKDSPAYREFMAATYRIHRRAVPWETSQQEPAEAAANVVESPKTEQAPSGAAGPRALSPEEAAEAEWQAKRESMARGNPTKKLLDVVRDETYKKNGAILPGTASSAVPAPAPVPVSTTAAPTPPPAQPKTDRPSVSVQASTSAARAQSTRSRLSATAPAFTPAAPAPPATRPGHD